MKLRIIDEKGRLFGKINIIDFLLILFLFCLTPMFYFGYRLFNKAMESTVPLTKDTPLDFYCRVNELTLETVKLISVGDKDNKDDKMFGEILALSEPEDDTYDIEIGQNRIISRRDPNHKQIFVKVRLLGVTKDNIFYYREERVSIGSKIPFTTEKYKIVLKIESMAEEGEGYGGTVKTEAKTAPIKLEPVELSICLKPLEPEKVKFISVGDIFLDNAGNNLGVILNVGEATTYSYTVDLGGGNSIYRQDPKRRELMIKAKLLGELKDNIFCYRGERVYIGSKIYLKTDKYIVEGIVKSEPTTMVPIKLEPVELSICLKPLEPEKVKFISVGDIFLDNAGNNLGVILNVGEATTYSYTVDLGGGNSIYRQDPKRRELMIKAKLLGELKDNIFCYRGERVSLGSDIFFKTDKYIVEGIVKSEPRTMAQQNVLLKIKFKDLIPEIANLIEIGEEEKNEEGTTISRIKSVVSNVASETFIQGEDKIIAMYHPVNRDVVLVIETICTKDNNKLLFKDSAIKIGKEFSFRTDIYDIAGTITGIINEQ